jgi:hypothetical protein
MVVPDHLGFGLFIRGLLGRLLNGEGKTVSQATPQEDWGPKCPTCNKSIDRLIPIMQGPEHIGWKCAPCTHELTTQMTPVPLPCPFCNGPAKLGTVAVTCTQCYACGPTISSNMNEAVRAWNHALRPDDLEEEWEPTPDIQKTIGPIE